MKMSVRWAPCLLLSVLTVTATISLHAVDVRNTRLMSQPVISQSNIAFVYAGDL